MIEVVFTIDYEIYGNGQGALDELVYKPARELTHVFNQAGKKYVVFTEAAELEKIAELDADPAIHNVHEQLRTLYRQGHEIALHLHPQWYRAIRDKDTWRLDYSEYNLCNLSTERIKQLVAQSVQYLRGVLDDDGYVPLSFRAGNWLFQPTARTARILADQGIKLDSSVFKGGRQHKHGLDYRSASKNGYWWRFSDDVNAQDENGRLLEIPIYTHMVPPWEMLTAKRLGLQKKSTSTSKATIKDKIYQFLDRARLRQPLKFDFCRMNLDELTRMIDTVIEADRKTPSVFKPIVAIGHTKDLVDLDTVEAFLDYLSKREIPVSTFENVYPKCVA